MKCPVTQEFIDSLTARRNDPNYGVMQRLGDVNRLYRDKVRKTSNQDGLPNSYRLLLFHLSMLPPGVTQLTLVKAAHLKPPTVSVTLQKMETDGLVTRKSNEHDLRQTLVYLTDKGRDINDKIRGSFESGNSIAMNNVSAEEAETLCRLLDKIIDNLVESK